MGVDQVDSIQLHNLVDEAGWQQAMGPGGALEALIGARDEGLVRFIGVTGHGTWAPQMHLRSLEAFEFCSVLCPYNFSMMENADYRADFEALEAVCHGRGVALQTIKSVARRRWPDSAEGPRFSWYEPIQDRDALARAVAWTLARPGVFLNSSSDGRLLRPMLESAVAAEASAMVPPSQAMREDAAQLGIEPLFVRGVSDAI